MVMQVYCPNKESMLFGEQSLPLALIIILDFVCRTKFSMEASKLILGIKLVWFVTNSNMIEREE